MMMNKNRSDQKRGTRSQINQKTIHREDQKLRENSKTGKKSWSSSQIYHYQEITGR